MTHMVGDPGHVDSHNTLDDSVSIMSTQIYNLTLDKVSKGDLVINVDDQPGTDDQRIDAALALATPGVPVWFPPRQFVVNTHHDVLHDYTVIEFAPGASIKLGDSPSGLLLSNGLVFRIVLLTGVQVTNPVVDGPAVAWAWPGNENAVFYIASSAHCRVTGGRFTLTDTFTGVDGGGYTNSMPAVMVRGPSSYNEVDHNTVTGGGIIYSYAGSDSTYCHHNVLTSSQQNALSGTGNGGAGVYNDNCVVTDNVITSPARMGIEDWTNCRNTAIERNVITSAGSYALSSVSVGALIANNAVLNTVGAVAIETNGSGNRVINNRVRWTSGTPGTGIMVNNSFVDSEEGYLIQGNRIDGAYFAIDTISNCLDGVITGNRIRDWTTRGIDLAAITTLRPTVVSHNQLHQTVPSTTTRYGIYIGTSNVILAQNNIQYASTASGGTNTDVAVTFGSASSGSLFASNTIHAGSIVAPGIPQVNSAGSPTDLKVVNNTFLGGAAVDVSGFGVRAQVFGNDVTNAAFTFATAQVAGQQGHGGAVFTGSGSPEGVTTANLGALYLRTGGLAGTTLYTKANGNANNVGWVAVHPDVATQTLASNGAVSANLFTSNKHRILLQANATSTTLTNSTNFPGAEMTISWRQDATGGRTYVWPTICKFAGGSAPSDTTASKTTSATFQFDGTNWYEISRATAVG